MEGSLPFPNSGLCGTALAPHRNASWDGVREKVERARHICNPGVSPMALLDYTFKSSSKSERPLRISAGVSFQDFPFLCIRKQGGWF